MFKYEIAPRIAPRIAPKSGIIRGSVMGRRTYGYARQIIPRVLFLNINNIFTLEDKKIIKGG